MCQVLTMLVDLGDYRYAATCEHGTIHIAWNMVSWHFMPRDLEKLVAFLEPHVPLPSPASEGNVSLNVDDRGSVRLWVATAGLAFSARDFLIFVAMIRAVIPKLEFCAMKILEAKPRSSSLKVMN